jgi:hypothetical protein
VGRELSTTFGDKYALVAAEIARLEGRDADAMRLYEQAIRSAREHGFVQNEGLAHELAARFFTARGFDTIAHACLREARRCYLRWGAFGKVRQLEHLHRHLRDAPLPASATTTIGAPLERLDVGTVLKAAQAVSGEIVLGELIKTLLRIAVEHAGAERGLLILFPGDEPRIAAEATTGRGQVEVTLRQAAVSPAQLPESVLHTVIRARESVILDDASAQNPFSADEYICQKRARSVLCLPLVKQGKLMRRHSHDVVFRPAMSPLTSQKAGRARQRDPLARCRFLVRLHPSDRAVKVIGCLIMPLFFAVKLAFLKVRADAIRRGLMRGGDEIAVCFCCAGGKLEHVLSHLSSVFAKD